MNSLFKISIFVALFCVIVAQKPGACPPAVGFGICVELCSDDSQCPADSKCCSNGCGHSCRKPVSTPTPSGECPETNDMIGICALNPNSCWSDSMCQTNQKCCKRGCGRECINVA